MDILHLKTNGVEPLRHGKWFKFIGLVRSDFDPGQKLFQMVMLPLNGVNSQNLELVSFMKELKVSNKLYIQ
jgi:hypothetical protein